MKKPNSPWQKNVGRLSKLDLFGDWLIATLLMFPVLVNPTKWIIGDEKVDVWNHVWGAWWWAESLSNGHLPWRTDYLQYPDGGTLWFIDPVLAFIGTPIALFSPVLAYNVGIWCYAMFASWSARRFALALGAAKNTAWLSSSSVSFRFLR